MKFSKFFPLTLELANRSRLVNFVRRVAIGGDSLTSLFRLRLREDRFVSTDKPASVIFG